MNLKVQKKGSEIFTLYKSEDGKVFCAKSNHDLVTMMRQDARAYSFEDNYDYMVFCKENTLAWNGVELDISSEDNFINGLVNCGLIEMYLAN